MEPGQSVSRSLGRSAVLVTVPWFKKKWAIPLLWGLAVWETLALTGNRSLASISKTANRHEILSLLCLGLLWRHFHGYRESPSTADLRG